MKIFEMSQNYNDGYLAITSCVIIAESEIRAREIAATDFGRDWRGAGFVQCSELGVANSEQAERVVIYECTEG